ncbi:erythromycin esterase family protein [Priestia megaterium]|uniref:erythromycin esterase family protein n=1 Tax=Priestia megaterium TaxID=1404 RepID=UPI002E1C8070|nr:erythromycin esterase family protein [Priestia megaterium]
MGIFSKGKERYLNSVEWLSKNSIHLSEPAECTPQEFEFLRHIVKDKRIVWLGENGHNIREHNMMKSKIIEFLHKEMNFTVLTFESGLAECYSANELKKEFTDEAFLKNAVYSLWATKENMPLFQLMKKSDLSLIGIDSNPSSNPDLFVKFVQQLSPVVSEDVIEKIEYIEAGVYKWYYQLGQYKAKRKKVPAEMLREFATFKEKASAVIADLEAIHKEYIFDHENQELVRQFKIILRCLQNRLYFINHFHNNYRTYRKVREKRMKENLEWVCQELYPDEKIIIWAHNLHIFKQYKTFTGFEPLGAIVSNEIKEQSYYLGLFMYEGEIHTDTGQPYKIEKPPKKSLEDYMHQVQSKWIFTKTIFLESGTMPTLFVPRDQLDGALLVESVSPPEYLKRNKNK